MECPKCSEKCKEVILKGAEFIKQFVCPSCGTTYSNKVSRKKSWNVKIK